MRYDELYLWLLTEPASPRYVGQLRLVDPLGTGAASDQDDHEEQQTHRGRVSSRMGTLSTVTSRIQDRTASQRAADQRAVPHRSVSEMR